MQTQDVLGELNDYAGIFKLLGDPTRLHIMAILSLKELCVCELVELLSLSQSNISQHLAKLRSYGLVKERKEAQWIYYSINWERTTLLKEITGLIRLDKDEIDAIMSFSRKNKCKI